ncbi:AlpA family transcriptional regulator [Stutzerimonas stutzeri]|uniref:AlpA family transcriptional regulator n=1 Tax=Stutzerimonas balearica DSM 6083 TaxID=1123016 RepID=A0A8D3XXT5_9GAMM|nr:AlpA family transcriptional regulator [Stutzerimonas balearica]AJE13701.1 AlpA family transcriptional regulator [Stutzerimonas balearica DSM 6083]KIL03668.1 AlpA family transcriptional regulator [Stutzerimonas stutzeri]SDL94621.1 transcriptional regulator, AlpA family [Stutzerimonas balearica DSM 6083]
MAAHTNPVQLPRRFIKLAQVKEYTSLSTSEIYRRIAAGTFPKQVKLGPKSSCFVESEVLAWCEQMAAQREVA